MEKPKKIPDYFTFKELISVADQQKVKEVVFYRAKVEDKILDRSEVWKKN